METAHVTKDLKSFECLSPSELDRKFYEEQSLLFAMSLEQLSTSRASNSMVVEASDGKVSLQASDHPLSETISPFSGFPANGLNPQDADNCHLAVSLQGKSSTPQVLFLKPKKAASLDQSYNELSASQMSWDVSLIKSESNSPRVCMESSVAEQTSSPKPQLQSLVEVSP